MAERISFRVEQSEAALKPRTWTVLALGTALLVAGADVALPVSGAILTGAGAIWSMTGNFDYFPGGGPCTSSDAGFSVYEGDLSGGSTEAFDGGLFVNVNGTLFDDDDGSLTGQTLRTGPMVISGIAVSRTDTALPSVPVLRTLIKLRNTTNTGKTANLQWDSAMGSDDLESTRASSDGDLFFEENDRWGVSSDSASDPPGPPAVTFALFGKGQVREKTAEVVLAPEDDELPAVGQGCVVFRFRVGVPADKTRYLLLFTEMHETNAGAIASTGKYNNRDLNNALLSGVGGPRKLGKIVNWDLV